MAASCDGCRRALVQAVGKPVARGSWWPILEWMRHSWGALRWSAAGAAGLFVLLALLSRGWPSETRPERAPPVPQRQLPVLAPALAQGASKARAQGSPPLAQARSPKTLPPLTIVEYGPQGAAKSYERLRVRFSQPVGTLEQIRDGTDSGIALGFDPPLRGRSRFSSVDVLEFDPAGELPLGRRLKARLRGPVTAQSGARYEGTLSWVIETERPSLKKSWPEEESDLIGVNEPVFLYWDQPIQIEALWRQLRGSFVSDLHPDAAPRTLPLVVARAEAAAVERVYGSSHPIQEGGTLLKLTTKGPWPAQSRISIDVPEGVRSLSGELRSAAPESITVRTAGPLRLTQASCDAAKPCGREPIVLRASSPLNDAALERVTVSPQPRWLTRKVDQGWRGAKAPSLILEGGFEPGTPYTVTVPAELTDIYGQKLRQAQVFRAVFAPRPWLGLSAQQGTLVATERPTVGLLGRHVLSVELRAILLTDEAASALYLASKERKEDEPSRVLPEPEPEPEPFEAQPWPTSAPNQIVRRVSLSPGGSTEWSAIALDLAELAARAGSGRGALWIEVRAIQLTAQASRAQAPAPVRGLFQVTELGPLVLTTSPKRLFWVKRLSDGAPVVGATISQHTAQGSAVALGTTDAQGLLTVPEKESASDAERNVIFVVKEPGTQDRTYVRAKVEQAASPKPGLAVGESFRIFLLTDRGVYRAGDRVQLAGWSAVDAPGSRHGLRLAPAGTEVQIQLMDPRDQILVKRSVPLTPEGSFATELALPKEAMLGTYRLTASALAETHYGYIEVREFRTPDFLIEAQPQNSGHLIEQPTRIRLAAKYYSGGAVPVHRVMFQSRCTPTTYRPPGLAAEWEVGDRDTDSQDWLGIPYAREVAVRDRKGSAELTVEVPEQFSRPGVANLCQTELSATDASYQSASTVVTYRVDPAPYFLAVAPPSGARSGSPIELPVRAVTAQGVRVGARGVQLSIRRIFKQEDGEPDKEEEQKAEDRLSREDESWEAGWSRSRILHRCQLTLSGTGPDASCTFRPARSGTYVLTLKGQVGRADARRPLVARTVTLLRVAMSPQEAALREPPLGLRVSKKRVAPGEVLEVSVEAPWSRPSGLLLVEGSDVRAIHPLAFAGGVARLTLRADEAWQLSRDHVRLVAVVTHRDARGLPAAHRAEHWLQIDPSHRQLKVRIAAPERAEPGQEVPIRLSVRDAAGHPTAARAALWVVNDALLRLTSYEVPDLIPYFTPYMVSLPFEGWARAYGPLAAPYREEVRDPWLSAPRAPKTVWRAHWGNVYYDKMTGSEALHTTGQLDPRSRFEPTPLFLADVPVGPDGEASARVKLPDDMTAFRILAVAAARMPDGQTPGRFGSTEATLQVQRSLVVRAALPRLLRPGDEAEAAAMVQSRAGAPGRVQVSLQLGPGSEALTLSSPAHVEKDLADGQVVRVPFLLRALRPGTTTVTLSATLQTKGGSVPLQDALSVPLSVENERTLTERVAIYESLADEQAVSVPVQLPIQPSRAVGGLQIALRTTLLHDLSEAARALGDYPHACAEQTASRMVPALFLRDSFIAPGMSREAAAAIVRGSIQRLIELQVRSGGFSYWPGSVGAHPFVSAYATRLLDLAQKAGYPVPNVVLDRATDYLEQLVTDSSLAAGGEGDITRALSLYVLVQRGRVPKPAIDALVARESALPASARALLVLTLHLWAPTDPRVKETVKGLIDRLLAQLGELPATAYIKETFRNELDSVFDSPARSEALILLALLRVLPQHPLVPKLARGLLERRRGGGWRNTQENAFGLSALTEFARLYEKEVPDLVATAWQGSEPLFEQRMGAPGASDFRKEIPMDELLLRAGSPDSPSLQPSAGPAVPLILQRRGRGRMYLRVGLEWAPPDGAQTSIAQGIQVERVLRTPAGPVAQGAVLAAGTVLALDLMLHTASPLRYVVTDVPLPAGLEGINPELTGELLPLPGHRGPFVSHQEARRDRFVVFADTLPPGSSLHTVYVRATTPGRYQLPPARAEAMYAPEVYGRSSGMRVIVR